MMQLKRRKIALASWLLGIILASFMLPLFIDEVAGQAAEGWTEPVAMLPYTRDESPHLCQNPLDGSMTYTASSGGYSIVAGNENKNWQNGVYTKLDGTSGQGTVCVYDEFGTLHVVWSRRNESEIFNFYYNRVLPGSNNAGIARNLSAEIVKNTNVATFVNGIAYSRQQKKLFLLYEQEQSVRFVESGDGGTTWSIPVELGVMSGYSPLPAKLITDGNGNPHIFYGVMNETAPSFVYHRLRRADGSWTAPKNIAPPSRGRPIAPHVRTAPDGDVLISWRDGVMDLARYDMATGNWTVRENVTGSDKSDEAAFAVAGNGSLWIFWLAGDKILFRTSSDNGATWRNPLVVADLPQALIGRFFSMTALAAKGKIYLLFSADNTDARRYVGPYLWLTTIGENNFTPPSPTPNPTPISPVVSPTPTLPPPGSPSVSPTPRPTVTPSPTISPTVTPTVTPGQSGDIYEPDNTLEEARARSRYAQPGQTEVHTLFDPRNTSGNRRDTDMVLLQADANKTYRLDITATGFQPKLSLYRQDGSWLGAANSCDGDTRRLCYRFSPEESGLYYVQFTNFADAPGDTGLVYSFRLMLLEPSPTPGISPSPTATMSPTASPTSVSTATSTATNTATASATATSQPTPTVTPTPQPTATPRPAVVEQPRPQPVVPPPAPTFTPVPHPTFTPTIAPSATPAPTLTPTPQDLTLPVEAIAGNSSGVGPYIVPPTATAAPTSRPTLTPTATARIEPTNTVSVQITTTPPVTNSVSAAQPDAPKQPPAPGAIWLLPVGLALLGKGLINLMASLK